MNFTYRSSPSHVIFGLPFPEAVQKIVPEDEITTFWVIASEEHRSLVEKFSDLEGVSVIEHFSRVIDHVPADQVQKARHSVAKSGPDVLLSIGGRAAVELAKAVALKHPIPIWSVPADYTGSEMTDTYEITTNGEKEIGRNPSVRPETVFYDTDLPSALPINSATASALCALANLVEATISPSTNPITYQQSLQGSDCLFRELTTLSASGEINSSMQESFQLGACLGGKSLSEISLGFLQQAARILSGVGSASFAEVHSVLLPFYFEERWSALDEDTKSDMRIAFGADHPPLELQSIMETLHCPSSLRDLGFDRETVESAVTRILNQPSPAADEFRNEEMSSIITKSFDNR